MTDSSIVLKSCAGSAAIVRLLFDGKDLGMVAVRVADADGHGVADLPAEDRLADGRLLAHEALLRASQRTVVTI